MSADPVPAPHGGVVTDTDDDTAVPTEGGLADGAGTLGVGQHGAPGDQGDRGNRGWG